MLNDFQIKISRRAVEGKFHTFFTNKSYISEIVTIIVDANISTLTSLSYTRINFRRSNHSYHSYMKLKTVTCVSFKLQQSCYQNREIRSAQITFPEFTIRKMVLWQFCVWEKVCFNVLQPWRIHERIKICFKMILF